MQLSDYGWFFTKVSFGKKTKEIQKPFPCKISLKEIIESNICYLTYNDKFQITMKCRKDKASDCNGELGVLTLEISPLNPNLTIRIPIESPDAKDITSLLERYVSEICDRDYNYHMEESSMHKDWSEHIMKTKIEWEKLVERQKQDETLGT